MATATLQRRPHLSCPWAVMVELLPHKSRDAIHPRGGDRIRRNIIGRSGTKRKSRADLSSRVGGVGSGHQDERRRCPGGERQIGTGKGEREGGRGKGSRTRVHRAQSLRRIKLQKRRGLCPVLVACLLSSLFSYSSQECRDNRNQSWQRVQQ